MESWELRRATVEIAPGESSIGAAGFGFLPSDRCSDDSCPAGGMFIITDVAVSVGPFDFPKGNLSLFFGGGKLSRDGSFVFQPETIEASVCGELKTGSCVGLHATSPLTGQIDFEKRRFTATIALDVANLSLTGRITNFPPTAAAGPDQHVTAIDGGATVTLDGSGSTDSDGELLNPTWKAVSGPLAGRSLAQPLFPGTQSTSMEGPVVGRTLKVELVLPPGEHLFQLSLMDSKMKFATALTKVRVDP